jgi:predicted RNA-binding Zn-ribbon protein involved in translation (DUF1610 family)
MNWYKKFMVGRYGTDQLTLALCILSFILSLFGNLTELASLSAVGSVLLALAAYRVFSKDMTRRMRENQKFLSVWNPLAARFKGRKTHTYFKCPSCGQHLRVPKKKGKLSIKCPKCGNEFKGRT